MRTSNRYGWMGLLAAAALAAGCASTPVVGSEAREVSSQQDRLRSEADAVQAGVIDEVNDDEIVLKPYGGRADELDLAMKGDVFVYQGDKPLNRSALHPGMDVRVYYDHTDEGDGRVLGIKLLTAEEAQRARQGETE